MKCCPFVLGTVLVVSLGGTTQAAGQEQNRRWELGLTFGQESLTRGGADVTAAAGNRVTLGGPGGYFGFFVSPRLLISVDRLTVKFADAGNALNVSSEFKYLFRDPTKAGPYASIGLAAAWGGRDVVEGGERAAGFGAGYRLPVTDRLTLQAGVQHRRWFSDKVGQTGLSLGLGFNFGSRR